MNKKLRNRMLPVIAAVMMLLAILPAVRADAGTSTVPAGYTPIYTVADLVNIKRDTSGNYILMNDLDLSGTKEGGLWDFGGGWEPIEYFSGVFDGNGHVIRNLTITDENTNKQLGLIGRLSGEVKNLGVENVSIQNTDCTYAGAIAGSEEGGRITCCYSTGKISIDNNDQTAYVGGITGGVPYGWFYSWKDYALQESYSTVDIQGGEYAGGLTTSVLDGYINNCYSIGFVSGQLRFKEDSYSSVYCLKNSGYINIGKQLNALQMQEEAHFTSFDFEKVWVIDKHSDYPFPQLRSCMQEPLESASLITPPNKRAYVTTDTSIDLTGGTMLLKYKSGKTQTIPLSEGVAEYSMKAGEQTVRITYIDKTVTFTISVAKVKGEITGSDSFTKYVGDSFPLNLKTNTDSAIKYQVNNTGYCLVNAGGTVTLLREGKYEIVAATDETQLYTAASRTIQINCIKQSPQLKVSGLSNNQIEVNVGNKITLGVSRNGDGALIYSSADNNIAKVSSKGVITGVKEGKTTVTVKVKATDEMSEQVKTFTVVVSKEKIIVYDQEQVVKNGEVIRDTKTGNIYKINLKAKTVSFEGVSKKKSKVSIPSSVKIGKVTYKVTEISKKALKNNSKLTSITIGKNIVKIGNQAFYGCKKLKAVTIPSKVKTIGKEAFRNCKKLKKITIKSKLLTSKKVGSNCFKGTAKKAAFKVPSKKLKGYKKWLPQKGMSKKAVIKR